MQQKHKNITSYNCDGVPIHAAVGLHESAISLIEQSSEGRGLALDLGCGSGAFSKRLQNLGYQTISADLSLDTFALDTESCVVDLNSGFSDTFAQRHYDVIIALEVIEHLENPLHFLRELKKLANRDTTIIISFPNLNLYVSFLSFLRQGAFANWNPYLYWETGHQTILTPWLFEAHLKKTGMKLQEMQYCAPFKVQTNSAFKHSIFVLLKLFVTRLSPKGMRASRENEVVLFKFAAVE